MIGIQRHNHEAESLRVSPSLSKSLRDSENRGMAAVPVSERLTHVKIHSLGANRTF